ncbi:DUF3231 family protein [Paenibacillus sp. YYML68]|uniref:DUF3231 family protein n=1 Tax=Paenibacillus sp. YYML68 TaxID=2909250 RepID=UPI002492EEC4|nr:DUF3231 family protein [Paenibacillus sp. YYML68]
MNKLDDRYITLTATEIGEIWKNYIGETLLNCVYTHFLTNTNDQRIKQLVEKAQQMTQKHILKLKEIFQKEKFALPVGFGSNDVHQDAAVIFTDKFYLFYLKESARINLLQFSNALTVTFREDIRAYFDECIDDTSELYQDVMNCMLAKGFIIRAPGIPIPKEAKLIESNDFLHKLFAKQRPLSSTEITGIYTNLDSNQLGKSLMIAFSQVASSPDIKKYMVAGRDLSSENIKKLQEFLAKDHLPSPQLWDAEVLESKQAPFSDKLMLFHVALANTGSAINFAFGITSVLRQDVVLAFAEMLGDIGKYADQGIRMLIENRWLEQPPLAADRDALVQS